MITTGQLLVSSTHIIFQRSSTRDGYGLLFWCPLDPEKMAITEPETQKQSILKKQIIMNRLKTCAKENKLHKATLSFKGRLVDEIPCGDS